MIALKAKYLLDGMGSKPVRNPTVIIEDGRIVEITTGQSDSAPQGSQTLKFSDGTILPGMINLHTHLTASADGRYYEHLRDESDNFLTLGAEKHAQMELQSGVTTVRDVGSPNRTVLDLRKGIQEGVCVGPRLVVAGRVVTTTGGHMRCLGIECDGPYEVRRAVRHLIKKEEVDFVKVVVTGGDTPGTDATYPSFTSEELNAAVDEAHGLNKKVVAHAGGLQGVMNAIEAGVDDMAHVGLKHPSNRDGKYHPDIGERIAKSGMIVHFTLRATYTRFAHLDKESEEYRARLAYFENKVETLGHLRSMGVKIGAGDDAGWSYVTFDGFVEELQLMTRGGMTPLEVIEAATGVAAQAMGLEHEIGSIECGKLADLIVVRGEPFSDLEHLRNVQLVMKEGNIVHQTYSSSAS